MTFFRALITYKNSDDVNQNIELLKEFCEMSFKTTIKHNQPIETESCCACDEAVYEVNDYYIFRLTLNRDVNLSECS